MTTRFDREGLHQLLYQARETSLRAAAVYEAALACAARDELAEEWRAHRDAARRRAQVFGTAFDALGLDADATSHGRTAAAALGKSLLEVIAYAAQGDDRAAALRVAAECVLLIETKDQLNRTLLGIAAERITGPVAQVLKDLVEAIEADGEPRALHARGWSRELWLDALGLAAVLPPPEEVVPGPVRGELGERGGLTH
ncbi:hypothetical protein [Burkholderia glumae]|uniref:hypothetical protein n=1 Tax=Burkholderia glumae TaxID=337 RepID=UPI0012952AD8|nr:hypothetical protein [Burkholderia glumae]MCM2550431.1 hypothetical protein [Burkholderia glumae]NVE22017.1 hypothetical protein [Burkholderia glumae]QGA38234.1 hypothetical protein GAS19_11820 [Burkholderia glumae]QJP71255.1 hypothetical protein HJC54_13290 [Burkholderia glumae]